MKRFFTLFLAVLVCVSLCVNIAFAQTQYDSYIHAYFPWFGGVGTAGAYLTNTGTVTSSDISVDSITVTNLNNGYGNSWLTSNGSVSNGVITVNTETSSSGGIANIFFGISFAVGHKYYIDTFNTGNFQGVSFTSYGLTQRINQGIFTATYSGTGTGVSVYVAGSNAFSISPLIVDLTAVFGAGSEPSSFEEGKAALTSIIGTYEYFSGSRSSSVSSFSLVPQSTVTSVVEQYVHEYDDLSFSVDLTGVGINSFKLSDYLYDEDYVLVNSGAYLLYVPESSVPSALVTGFDTYTSFNMTQNPHMVRVAVDPNIVPFYFDTSENYNNGIEYDSSFSNVYLDMSIDQGYSDSSSIYTINGSQVSIHEDPFLDRLNSVRVSDNSALEVTGSISLDTVSNKEIYNTVIYSNNTVNLGTYDFNINVVFPNVSKFNAFSGYWMGSFNTSWGEIPVRTQVQEVSSNSNTFIKIYKVTFDVPFTGSYTSFNIKYIGDSSAFTTIRVDSSVIDPNAYKPTQNQVTSLNGFVGWLNGALDSLWGKIRSLFFDNDQTMAESVPSEAGELAGEVSSGAQTIHEFETNNFDSIETQQQYIDWDIPDDFGSSGDTGSAIGFVSMLFMGIYQALGVKVQYVIVVPLILGLVLLVLGRGSMALGKLVDSLKR